MLKPPEVRPDPYSNTACRPSSVVFRTPSGAGEITGAKAAIHPGLRKCLLLLNTFDILVGIVCLVFGIYINKYITESMNMPANHHPFAMLMLGIVPLGVGLFGVVCVLVGRRLWIVAWILGNVIPATAVHIYIHITRCLQPERYSVNMHIYGDCRTINQTIPSCTCSWSQHHLTLNGPCHLIWFVTTCFLSVIALYTLFLAGSIISSVLGCISVTCLNHCMHQGQRGPEGSTMRNYSTFVTEFVPHDGCSKHIPMSDDISTAI